MMLPAEEMIVFVKGVRPMILERVGCHEIEPLRAGLGINPLHGKRFQGRLKVRM